MRIGIDVDSFKIIPITIDYISMKKICQTLSYKKFLLTI